MTSDQSGAGDPAGPTVSGAALGAVVRQRGEYLADRSRLLAALRDALEGLEEMLPYVPEYFVEKHELDGYLDRARDALREVGS